MALYAGIDLHSTNHVLVVIDEHDRVHYEKRLPNELGATLDALAPFRDDLFGIALESTYNWYWLVEAVVAGRLNLIEGQPQVAEWFLVERPAEQFPISRRSRVAVSAEGEVQRVRRQQRVRRAEGVRSC